MDKYQLAANIEIAGISGHRVKLTAKQQKEIFGGYLFGKQSVWCDLQNQGEVVVSRSVCFGTDSLVSRYTLEEVAIAANEGRDLRCS